MNYAEGDRIELVSMADDPAPIPPGTRGTVRKSTDVDFGRGDRFTQLWVDWDDGSRLMPCIPPDRVRVVTNEGDQR